MNIKKSVNYSGAGLASLVVSGLKTARGEALALAAFRLASSAFLPSCMGARKMGRLFGDRFPVGHLYKGVPPLFGGLAMRFWAYPPLGSAPGPS